MLDKKLATICGVVCEKCKHFKKQCNGCQAVNGKPFWIKFMNVKMCHIYNCCINKKKIINCGLCNEFPCEDFMKIETNDPNFTPEKAKKSAEKRKAELIKRSEKQK